MKKRPIDDWSRSAWLGAVIGACTTASLAVTWPLALQFADAVPLGTETAATIPVFDIWSLWWSADRLLHGYMGLWNAPIFHPASGTFAFSEPLLLPGAIAAPLFAARAPPALAHNVVLIALLSSNGGFACRLLCALRVPRLCALLAGVCMVTLPFLAKVQGEVPLLGVGGTIAALDGLVRFGEDGRTRHAATASLGLVAEGLVSQQLALLSLAFLAAAAVVALSARRFAPGAVGRLAVAALAAGIILYLIARTPIRIHHDLGFRRDEDLVRTLSAKPTDFLSRPLGSIVPFPPCEDPTAYTGGLFPGILILGLAFVGARVPTAEAQLDRWRWYALAACWGAFLLSLGLNLSIGGWRPFATLRALPGFDEIRSIFRAAVLVQIHLVILAALGLARLARRLSSPRAKAVVIAGGFLAGLENLSVPAPLLAVPRSPRTAWTAFLGRQPPGSAVAHVPFPKRGSVEDLAPEAWRMFAQIDHRQPLVNGYASNFPPLHREFMFAMGGAFPNLPLACALRRVFGTDFVVADRAWASAHRADLADLGSLLQPAYEDDDVTIYRVALRPPPSECPPMRIDLP